MDERAGQGPSTARGRVVRFIVPGLLGVAALSLLWWFAPWHTASPITLTGMAYANHDATAIGFAPDSRFEALRRGLSGDGEGFNVAGAVWTDLEGTMHEGSRPSCLTPGERTPIELSFLRVRYRGDDGGPTRVVTGLRCLP